MHTVVCIQFCDSHRTTSIKITMSMFADASDESSQVRLLKGHLQENSNVPGVSSIRSDDESMVNSASSGMLSQQTNRDQTPEIQLLAAVAIPSDDLQSPMDELIGRYRDKLDRCCVTWGGEDDEFTSAFVSIETKECFLSGEVVNGNVVQRNYLNWYGTRQEARNAAIVRAIDCFELRDGSPRPFGRRVQEPPYLLGNGPELSQSIPLECMKRIECLRRSRQQQAHHSMISDTSSLTGEQSRSAIPAPSPKARSIHDNAKSKLHERYHSGWINGRHVVNGLIPKKNFVSWSFGMDHTPRYSAAFVCPLSGEIFVSGELINYGDDEPFEKDGLFWYSGKKKSIIAAAACAFDCFAYREDRSNDEVSAAIQFCIAQPYQEENEPRESIELEKSIPCEYWNAIQKLQQAAAWRLP